MGRTHGFILLLSPSGATEVRGKPDQRGFQALYIARRGGQCRNVFIFREVCNNQSTDQVENVPASMLLPHLRPGTQRQPLVRVAVLRERDSYARARVHRCGWPAHRCGVPGQGRPAGGPCPPPASVCTAERARHVADSLRASRGRGEPAQFCIRDSERRILKPHSFVFFPT
jgi:hypothetical protein